MRSTSSGRPGPGTARALVAAVALVVAACAVRAEATETIYQRFDEISALRANGEFDRAISVLQGIIEEYAELEEILRRAYNDLVLTVYFKRAAATDPSERERLMQSTRAEARRGLTAFPDLSPELGSPPEIKQMYDDLRARMFGRLVLTTEPDSCRVFIDDTHVGSSPIEITYYPVGSYQLSVSREGYKDEVTELTITPNGLVQREISLSKERNRGWWLTRVVAPVAAGVGAVVALLLSGEDEQPVPEEPLPGPPDPPSQ